MNYGCIGEKLKHSFSKEIHGELADYDYELCEVAREELSDFAERRDFKAINVTIPYKELIIPHLYYIDEHAALIGAVNTVVNREGKLYGYNTDFYGMSALIHKLGISLEGRKVVILGTGGTSKTALAVAKSQGAKEVIRVSRDGREGAATYEELYSLHTDAEVIINTTPVGMYPHITGKAAQLDRFPRLIGAVDAVYNPLRTPFIREAQRRGIPAEGGLYMLVAQAVRASEIFLGVSYPEGTPQRVYEKILRSKENIVLVGMPASGKSTVGRLLSKSMGRALVDTDDLVVAADGRRIADIFKESGEAAFRDMESDAVLDAAARTSVIIATGGGAILREENVEALRQNGRLYFIDRDPEELIPTSSRPLSSDREAIMKRYNERYGIYSSVCDVHIKVDTDAPGVADRIKEDFLK